MRQFIILKSILADIFIVLFPFAFIAERKSLQDIEKSPLSSCDNDHTGSDAPEQKLSLGRIKMNYLSPKPKSH
jgi:hypothetical protein